jgi:hypothetical protein
VPKDDGVAGETCSIKSVGDGRCITARQSGGLFLSNCDGTIKQKFDMTTIDSPESWFHILPVESNGNNRAGSLSSTGKSSVLSGAIENNTSGPKSFHPKELLRNSYILIGIVAATLVGLLGLIFLAIKGKGSIRSVEGPKERYSNVAAQKKPLRLGADSDEFSVETRYGD